MLDSRPNPVAAGPAVDKGPGASQRLSRPAARIGAKVTRDRVLLLIVLAAVALRFATLGTQSLWADEGFTAKIAGHALGSAASQVPNTESTPPLYYALVWIWAHLFGSSAYALRSLSALLGSITVAAVYWGALAVATRRVALIAAALTAVSPIMVWYSQEARAYALFVLLSTLALGFFLRALRESRRAWLLGWAVCSAAALATHYFALFPLIVEAAWLLARGPQRRELLVALGLPAVVGAALIPLVTYQHAHVPRPWTSIFTVIDQVKAIAQSFLVGISWTSIIHRAGVAILAALVVLALAALVRSGSRDERKAAGRLAVLFVVTLALPVVISLIGTNYLAPRNVLYAWPVLALLVALGAGRQAAGRLSIAGLLAGLAVSLAIVIAVDASASLQRADWRDLLAPLRSNPHGRAVVLIDGFENSPVVEYYLPALGPPAGPTAVHEVDVISTAKQAPTAAAALPVSGLTPAGSQTRQGLVLSRFVAPAAVTMPVSPPPGSPAAFLVAPH
ncbi:MAG TPA: glycosyltransferase family 39 protein [Solirubrobacteraceae bacterium]